MCVRGAPSASPTVAEVRPQKPAPYSLRSTPTLPRSDIPAPSSLDRSIGYTAVLSSLAGQNAIFLLAAISIDLPVTGFLPIGAVASAPMDISCLSRPGNMAMCSDAGNPDDLLLA
jgi:hypothetical protein